MGDFKILPKCPHCGYEFDAEETWYSTYSKESRIDTNDGASSEVKCHNSDCEKKFTVYCEAILMFKCE